MKLGPEYIGKLPPGAQEQLDQSLASWRASGVVSHVEIMGDCAAAKAQAGLLYSLDTPPTLPLPGCDQQPCCNCCYIAVLDDEDGSAAKPVAS